MGAVKGLATLPRAGQWALLVAGSAGFAAALQAVRPAGGAAARPDARRHPGRDRRRHHLGAPAAYFGAQAVIGCLIAGAITPAILVSFLRDWPLFLAMVLSTLVASSLLGWLMSRWQVLPGTTGVWGSSPGAATAMVLMAEAFGADAQLVAFMQYLRVVCVAVAASLIARLLGRYDRGVAAADHLVPAARPAVVRRNAGPRRDRRDRRPAAAPAGRRHARAAGDRGDPSCHRPDRDRAAGVAAGRRLCA